jgi:ketosteroid isomerase-like protein
VFLVSAFASEAHPYRRHVSFWAAVLGGAAAIALALGIGVLVGRSTASTEPSEGLAQNEVVAAIDGTLAALNRGDFQAFATYWAKDAVFEEPGIAGVLRGREAIVGQNEGYFNLGARYYRESAVIQRGDLAAYVVSCPTCPGQWSGIDVVRFTDGWKIDHLWTGNTAGAKPER